MPRKEEMSWEPAKKRWAKMFKGQRYFAVASSLGPVPTREATRDAANKWWQEKKAELDGYQKSEAEVLYEQHVEATRLSPIATFEPVLALIPDNRAKSQDRSIRGTIEAFLQWIKGDLKPRSYRELLFYFNTLKSDLDVATIDEDKVEEVYLSLARGSLSAATRKKHWGFYRRYVKYLWSKRLIDLPRNLDTRNFKVTAKKIPVYTTQQIRDCLAKMKPRLRLYGLLALNTGMNNCDIGQLTKDMVDLEKGIITRRRSKTGHISSTPTVCYKLWPETLTLLRQCWSTHNVLALTSSDGTQLWQVTYAEDGTTKMRDTIVQQWKRKRTPIPLKAFRSVSATLLGSHESYGRFAQHFLGHTPKSVSDKHYISPSQQLFDQAIAWLHGQLFS